MKLEFFSCLYFSIVYISEYFHCRRASIKIKKNLVLRYSEEKNHCRQVGHGMESDFFLTGYIHFLPSSSGLYPEKVMRAVYRKDH